MSCVIESDYVFHALVRHDNQLALRVFVPSDDKDVVSYINLIEELRESLHFAT